jgi:hypothetical protein
MNLLYAGIDERAMFRLWVFKLVKAFVGVTMLFIALLSLLAVYYIYTDSEFVGALFSSLFIVCIFEIFIHVGLVVCCLTWALAFSSKD